jgi:hypothetical protein
MGYKIEANLNFFMNKCKIEAEVGRYEKGLVVPSRSGREKTIVWRIIGCWLAAAFCITNTNEIVYTSVHTQMQKFQYLIVTKASHSWLSSLQYKLPSFGCSSSYVIITIRLVVCPWYGPPVPRYAALHSCVCTFVQSRVNRSTFINGKSWVHHSFASL